MGFTAVVESIQGERARFPRGAAPDLWRHTLVRIPTTFGRLAYLASLRNPNTGRYEHHGLAQIFGDEETDQTLGQSHNGVFAEWLIFGIEQQKLEVSEYLSALDGPPAVVLATWSRLAPYRNFVPATAGETERSLYLSDLETVLELLRHEHGVASPDPDS